MKKAIIAILFIFCLVGIAHAKTYHLFFIAKKSSFVVDKITYPGWPLGTDPVRYFMEPGGERPEGYQVTDVRILSSEGIGKDETFRLYGITRDESLYYEAQDYPEYAGGSNTTTAAAWLDLTVNSYEQNEAHASLPAGTVAKETLRVRWKDDKGDWVGGKNLKDWKAAGKPSKAKTTNPGLTFFGVD